MKKLIKRDKGVMNEKALCICGFATGYRYRIGATHD
jgi:hypothetical protein